MRTLAAPLISLHRRYPQTRRRYSGQELFQPDVRGDHYVKNDRMPADRALKEGVFLQMFNAHYTRVVRYAHTQLSDHAAAEDIASEVFRVAWQKLDPHAPFGLPWLIRTAMHKSRDAQRGTYRHAAALGVLAHAAHDASGEPSHLERLALYEAMSKLAERDRQILQLTYWNDLSAGEVAEVLRIRQGTVWTRLHRARERLRMLMAENVEGQR